MHCTGANHLNLVVCICIALVQIILPKLYIYALYWYKSFNLSCMYMHCTGANHFNQVVCICIALVQII